MDKEKKTIIKLHESTSTHGFKHEELIHRDEFDAVLQKIKDSLVKLPAMQQADSSLWPLYSRYYNTISVFGERGTGKTSFLYSLLSQINNEGELRRDVEILGFLDPTQIEEKEHVFLLVVSLINQKVKEQLGNKECKLDTDAYTLRKLWDAKLRKLAKGLPTLKKVGGDHQSSEWQDQDFIMERGLDSVSSAYNLEHNFHELVSEALRILGKKAFVLALDDIDVDMEKGWDVLEMLRKYLTTPQIITILSGNMKLYTLNVRKQQWKELKDNKDYEKTKDFNSLVNELEGQYMMKVLKSENRIHLRTILEAVQLLGKEYIVEEYRGKQQVKIQDAYNQILSQWGIEGAGQQEVFRNYLMSLSLRSQMQFLNDNEHDEEHNGVDGVEAFLSRLYASNVDVDLAVRHAQMLDIVIQKYIEGNTMKPDLYLLTPTHDDGTMNACVTGMTILFAKKMKKHPFLFFDYMVRMGYVRNLALRMNKDERASFYNHVGMTQLMSLKNNVGLSLSYTLTPPTTMILQRNHIALEAMSEKAKKSTEEKKGSIDYEVGKAKNRAQRVLAYLPISLIGSRTNEAHVFYSVYNLLAAVAEVCKIEDEDQMASKIKAALMNLQQPRQYPAIRRTLRSSVRYEEMEEETVFVESGEMEKEDDSLNMLAEDLINWRKSVPKTVPPYLIGHISTRLFSTLPQINKDNLGEQMHRTVVALLNACLVEEATEYYKREGDHDDIDRLNRDNAVKEDTIFLNNLDFIRRNDAYGKMSLTFWVARCPLLWPFLNLEKLLGETMKTKNAEGNEVTESPFLFEHAEQFNLYKLLENVNIKGRKREIKPIFHGSVDEIQGTINVLIENKYNIQSIFVGEPAEVAEKINESKIFAGKVKSNQITSFRTNCPEEYKPHPEAVPAAVAMEAAQDLAKMGVVDSPKRPVKKPIEPKE